MPLLPGKANIGRNISELTHHGSRPRSHQQIVAIALANADRHPRTDGGAAVVDRAMRVARRQFGGVSGTLPEMPYFERSEARDITHQPYGLSLGFGGGRTDKNAVSVAANSYVLPADVVAGLGDGNSLAGAKTFDMILHSMPWGIAPEPQRATHRPPAPPHDPALMAGIAGAQREPISPNLGGPTTMAAGGAAVGDDVPIMAADGERILSPLDVLKIGQHYSPQRDLDAYPATHRKIMLRGHQVLDHFVKAVRGATIRHLKGLRGPVGSHDPSRGHA